LALQLGIDWEISMNEAQKKVLHGYISQLQKIADKAEKLQSKVDDDYRAILKTEVEGYRQLIEIWRKRIESGN
jgi:hypothetical protein